MLTAHKMLSRLGLPVIALLLAGCGSNSQPSPQVGASSASQSSVQTPRNGPIAFGRFDRQIGAFTLWTANADGSHQRRLTTTQGYFPDWRPDGSGLAFDYPDGTNEHIATIGRDGSRRTQLTSAPGIQEVARYSRDGRHIVFDASAELPDDPAFSTDIWMMDFDGSHQVQITHGGFDVEPVFSPDGHYIAFGRLIGPTGPTDFSAKEAIYVVGTDGTGLRRVVAPKAGLEHPRWSPDGSALTFNIAPEAAPAPDAGSIFSVDPNGHGLHVIRAASHAWKFTKATWSPDGRKMLVVCHRVAGDIDYLCQMNPRTGQIHVVVTTPLDEPVNYPSWGPKQG